MNGPRVGDKRIKEPSSYNTSLMESYTKSFSNLSLGETSNARSYHASATYRPPASPPAFARDRSDSNNSRECDSSALDRFIGHFDAGFIEISALVRPGSPHFIDFTVKLRVREFGERVWVVRRSVEDVRRFCDAIRKAGAGSKFPMPPALDDLLGNVCVKSPEESEEKLEVPKPRRMSSFRFAPPGFGRAERVAASREELPPRVSEAAGMFTNSWKLKPHPKKKVFAGNGEVQATSLIRAMSAKFGLIAQKEQVGGKKKMQSNVYPSVEEWFEAALMVWQKRWRSKSDEDGIGLAFEMFVCEPAAAPLKPTSSSMPPPALQSQCGIPTSLRSAVDALVLSSAILASQGVAPAAADVQQTALPPPIGSADQQNFHHKREDMIARAMLRVAKESSDMVPMEALKFQCLTYAWAYFEMRHPIGMKDLVVVLPTSRKPSQIPTGTAAAAAAFSAANYSGSISPTAKSLIRLSASGGDSYSSNSDQTEIPFMFFQIRPELDGQSLSCQWFHFTSLVNPHLNLMNSLMDNFSVPPSPRSFEHFHRVWTRFTDVVLGRVEERLQRL